MRLTRGDAGLGRGRPGELATDRTAGVRARKARGARQSSRRTPGLPIDPDDWATWAFLRVADALGAYHRHRVLNLERLGRPLWAGRRVVLVGNHALDIVDPLLLLATVYRRLRRVPRFVGHENGWFRVPVLRDVASRFQVIPSRRPEETVSALRRDGFLMLFPGANREAAMRSYRDEPYRLKWDGRTGFLRVALEAEADIVFVAAIGSDEAYYQSRLATPETLIRLVNAGDATRYRGMPLTFGLLGAHLVPGLFPFPVQLTHVVAHPLDLGDRESALRDPDAFARLHQRVWAECQAFLETAVGRRNRHSDGLDQWVRSAERWLQGLGI